MAYDHSSGANIGTGPADELAGLNSRRTAARSWRVLTEACRLAAVEQALSPANDRIDEFPLAL